MATVSDDEEEGGVLLTEASADEIRKVRPLEENSQVHSNQVKPPSSGLSSQP